MDKIQFEKNYALLYPIALEVRKEMENLYGTDTDLCGHCIEGSEKLAARINKETDFYAVTKEGYCSYDDGSFCSDVPYDPHTWVEIPKDNIYLDVTADQFNYGMYLENEFSPVMICYGLPHGMSYEEPELTGEWAIDTEKCEVQSLNQLIKNAEKNTASCKRSKISVKNEIER